MIVVCKQNLHFAASPILLAPLSEILGTSIQSHQFKHAKTELHYQKGERPSPASHYDARFQSFELNHDPVQLLF
jgi:hypothetical protein